MVLEPETQYLLTNEMDKTDRIEKIVEMAKKQLDKKTIVEGLLMTPETLLHTIKKAHHRDI